MIAPSIQLPKIDPGQFRFGRVTPRHDDPVPEPVQWIQENFYLYDRQELMTLFDCQVRPLHLAMERDARGRYRYNTVLWSWPKKSAKSTVIAAMVDYIAWTRPRSSIKLVANDLKQADSRVGYYLRESLRYGPRADRVKIKPSGYMIEYDNGSTVNMVPIDPAGEAGGNDDLIVYSELWGWKSKAHQRMWSEMTLSPNKFGNSQRWIDTYAGFVGESPILEQLYETGVKQGRRVFDDLEVYVNDAAKLLVVWVTKHLLPWQNDEAGREYYAQEAANLLPNEYRRMHRNEWVSSQDVFVPLEWWDACKGDYPDPDQYEPWVLAMDAGVSGDTFALVAVARHPQRQNETVVRYARKWMPPAGGKIDFQGTPENPGPELEVRRLVQNRNVIEVAYDPYQLEDMANRLRKEGLGWFRAFSQAGDRLIADSQLRTMIQERRLAHRGEPELREHIGNANAETDKEERKIRIVKRSEKQKIDLAVALSMANHECMRLNL